MPVFNGEPYLEASIRAILKQTFSALELVISDNASTDGTERICRHFARIDDRVRYFRNKQNVGAAKNYNRVFELTRAEYFKWATADDLCRPDYLEQCVRILDEHDDVVLCFGRSQTIDEHGAKLDCYESGIHLRSDYATGRFLQVRYSLGKCDPLCGLHRADALRRTQLIGTYIAADACLLAELALIGKFYELPDYLFFRRQHEASSSAQGNRSDQRQLEFYDPQRKVRAPMKHWRLLWEHFKVVGRARLTKSEKALLFGHLAASMLGNRRQLTREIFSSVAARLPRPRGICSLGWAGKSP